MSALAATSRFSPELRASLYHFTVFITNGAVSVYFGIWLANRGISADEIGIINAAPVLGMLALNMLVGRLADRARDWRSAIVVLSLIAGAVPFGLFFVSGFWGILMVWTLAMLPAVLLVPVTDAATLRMTQRRGSDFGVVRAWGTVGYMAATMASGPLIAWLGDASFVPLFVVFALCRAAISLQLPAFRSGEARTPAPQGSAFIRLQHILKPWFLLALIGLGIVYSTHGVLSAFAALLWKEQGISEAWIGPLFATCAAAEALMMFMWSRLKIKVSARHLILFAALVAAFRWAVMALAPPLWLLFLLQLLHSITFAVGYLGGIYFIANWTRQDIAAEAQGFAFVLQQGMTVVALVGMGWAVGLWGNGAWLALGLYSLAGAGLVWLSLLLQGPTTHPTTVPPPPLRPEDGTP